MHVAALNENSNIYQYLVSTHKCDTSAKDFVGLTPANLLDVKKGTKSVHDVLRHLHPNSLSKALCDLRGDLLEGTNHNDASITQLATIGNLRAFKKRIESSPDRAKLVQAKGPNGETLIHDAAFAGNTDIVEYLVNSCNSDFNLQDSNGHSPLHNAAHNGQTGVVQFLCSCPGILLSQHDEHKRTPLHYAAQNDHFDVVKCLVEDYNCGDVMHEDKTGVTPFQLSAEAGNFAIIKFLAVHPTCNPQHKDAKGRTALHGASQNGHVEVGLYLVNHCKCDPMDTDSAYGVNSIHLVASSGCLELLKFYTTLKGCSLRCKSNLGGRTPFHQATQHGHYQIILFLLEEHSDEVSVMESDNNGVTPFHLAAFNGHMDILLLFLKQHNVKPEQTDGNGRNAVHCGSQEGHLQVVKLLVDKHSCSVSTKDRANVTPLHLAAGNGHSEVARFLGSRDPSLVEVRDGNQCIALHYACQHGHQDVVKVLVEELKSRTDAKDLLGATPCQVARINGHSEIVQYLSGRQGNTEVGAWSATAVIFL